jgi:uncharacterized membrane protein YuzA (DUF378 family)
VSQDAPTIAPRASGGEGSTPPSRGRPHLPPLGSPAVAARLSLVLIGIGALVRLVQYLSGRSLWLDESFLWLNLSHKSASDLLGPLDLAQGAPPLFALSEKLSIDLFGDGEMALRLVPLLAGLAALPLVYLVARRCLRPAAVPVAVALIALSTPITYYATEAKQYSLDLAVGLALLLLGLWIADARLTAVRGAIAAAAGAIAVWASDPSVFVLGGIGASLLVAAVLSGDRRRLAGLLGVTGAWLVSFGFVYVVHVTNVSEVRELTSGNTGPLERLAEVPRGVVDLFDQPIGVPTALSGFAAFLAAVGALAMYQRGRGLHVALLTSPIAVMAIAVMLGQYPIGIRFGMFLVGPLVILAAAGTEALARATRGFSPLIGALIVVAILAAPAVRSAHLLAAPLKLQEQNEVVSYVAQHRRPGDAIYVYYAAQYAFAYYGPRNGIATPYRAPALTLPRDRYWFGVYPPVIADTPALVVGRFQDDLGARIDDVDRLRGRGRVWLVFSHWRYTDEITEPDLMVQRASGFGRVLDTVDATGARAVLMDLR